MRFKFGKLGKLGASAERVTASIRNTAITTHSTATSDSAWDAGANEKRLKSDQPASYYKKMYAWKDGGEDGTKKTHYKFPHHMVSESGEIGAANIKACQSGIGALNGARNKANIPDADRKGVYAHLSRHIKDAGLDPAPLNEIKEQALVMAKNRAPGPVPTLTALTPSTAQPFFASTVRPDGALELAIYTMIGQAPWSSDEEGVTVASIKSALDAAPQCSSICLRINSPGGDVFQGVAILNVLRSQSKPVTVMIDGIAASAASVIAMAGSKVLMGSGAAMMIHRSWGGCMGNYEDMENMSNRLSMIDKCIAATYVERTRMTEDDVLGMMKSETWMSAQDCINHGFATGMQVEGTDAPPAQIKAQLPSMVTVYRAQVEAFNLQVQNSRGLLAADLALPGVRNDDPEPEPGQDDPDDPDSDCECDCASCQDGTCSNCTNTSCDDTDCADCPMRKKNKTNGLAGTRFSNLLRDFQLNGHAEMSMGMGGGVSVGSSSTLDTPILAIRAFGSLEFKNHKPLKCLECQSENVMMGKVGPIENRGYETWKPESVYTCKTCLKTWPIALAKGADAITGTLAPYNSASCDLGGFVEVYERGCFNDYLGTDDPRVCLNHNVSQVLGRKSSGTARFTDTPAGLVYECDLPDTTYANDLRTSMARGDIRESSAAFFILEKRLEVRGGIRTRVVTKARLVEGGPHVFAAYGDSTVSSVIDGDISAALDNPVNSGVTDDTIQGSVDPVVTGTVGMDLTLITQTIELLKIS